MQSYKNTSISLIVAGVLATILLTVSSGQGPDVPNAYKGVVPGVTTFDEVRKVLGESPIKTQRGDDLRYPVAGNPDLNDRLFFRDGKVNYITSATPDPRYPNLEKIVKTFGTPEARTRFQTQEYLDYTEKGLR